MECAYPDVTPNSFDTLPSPQAAAAPLLHPAAAWIVLQPASKTAAEIRMVRSGFSTAYSQKWVDGADGTVNLIVVEVFGVEDRRAETFRSRDEGRVVILMR